MTIAKEDAKDIVNGLYWAWSEGQGDPRKDLATRIAAEWPDLLDDPECMLREIIAYAPPLSK